MDKISIVIPVYNAEKYLRECLDSVADQTYSNIEVIMVNDGSKDGSEQICREYEQKDDRFHLISGPNHGASGARNIGLKRVTGDYVAFIDSDDWYDLDYLEYLLNGARKANADIFACDFKTNGEPEYKWSDHTMSNQEALWQILMDGWCNRTPNKLYKRETLDGIPFPEGRDLCEDASWTAQVLEKARICGRGSEAKYNIRLTEGSITRKRYRTDKELCGFYRNTLERLEIFLRNYPADPKFKRLVDKECNKCLTMIVESGGDLNLWDVYKLTRKIVTEHKDIALKCSRRPAGYIMKYEDYRKCNTAYFIDTLLSVKEPFSHKKSVVKERIGTIIRRNKLKTRRKG